MSHFKRVRPKSLYKPFRVLQLTCRPRFSFFCMQFSKNGHMQTQCHGLGGFWPHARSRVAYAALFEFSLKSLSRLSNDFTRANSFAPAARRPR